MTAAILADSRVGAGRIPSAAVALATGLALALVVGVRWQIYRTAALNGIAEGSVFGCALVAVALVAGVRPSVPRPGPVMAGAPAGAVLVAVSLLARWPAPPLVLGHAAPFLPWVVVTTLVATGEELVLRGVLWHWTAAASGSGTALLVTSLAFALIHVPVYGWHVVPLDLGVGLFFGGLRLWFGGPAAPAAAHIVADLATWWL